MPGSKRGHRAEGTGELRFLILEDAVADAKLCERELQRAGLRFKMRQVETLAEFEAELDRGAPDLIISDFTFPGGFDGLAALEIARRKLPDVPFLFFSGTIGEERAVQAIQRGAADYVLKDRMNRLGPAVVQVLERSRLLREKDRAEAALLASEERLRLFVEHAPAAIAMLDNDMKYIAVSRRWLTDYRIGEWDVTGRSHYEVFPEIPEAWKEIHRRCLAGAVEKCAEDPFPRLDGRTDLVRWEIHPWRRDGGEIGGIILFSELVTERKLQQQKIERLSRIRTVSSEINSAIVRSHSRQILFYEACRIAVEDGNFGLAWIGLLDPETLDVAPVAWAGLGSDEMKQSKATARPDVPQGQGVLGRAVRERKPAFDNDISIAKGVGGKRREEALRLGYRSLIVVPLFTEKAVSGILALFAKEAGFFDEEEVRLLTELSGNLSFALDNLARQEKLDKLSRIRAISSGINAAIARVRERGALLKEICRIASEQGKFEMVWIGTLDHEKQSVRPIAWTGFSPATANAVSWATMQSTQGTLGEAVRTRKPAVRDDILSQLPAGKLRQEAVERGCHSTVCLPLVVEDEVTALIVLFASGRSFFDQDELTILDEVTLNVSFALEFIARQEKFERLSRIRSVLGQINAAIVRTRDRQELFDEACRVAVEAGGLPFAWIGVVERDLMQVRPAAWAGLEDPILCNRESRRPLDEHEPGGPGSFARAIFQKKAVIANDVQSDPLIARKRDHLERNINSIAVFPLLVAGEAAGILILHARETGYFDAEEVKLLSELAGDIAFAMQNIDKQEQLDYLSYYDSLTGLPNRTLFIDRAGQQLRARGGEPRMVALILLNIERFRYINESFGRHGGDALLKLVAQRLEASFNSKDYLARIGADSFGVVIRGIRDAETAVHAVENQVLGCFREPFQLDGNELRVSAKAGIAMFPADGADADTLFKNAEAALKKARDSSERHLFYAADMNARVAQVLSMETRLRKAVEAQQFVLHYQPKIELSTDKICGLEALIRWQEPGGELVPPGAFIPLLEETGLILEVGKWALGRAFVEHREWTARGCKVPRIAVNVSAIQLQQRDFSDMVINVVQEHGGGPDALELEVTESLLMRDVEGSIRKLSLLRGLGIHVAMDDFGTGYSSLSYIAKLPISSVKIDRSFINGMANSPQDMAIVTTIIALAHSLNLRVVAEGVETESQSKLLKLLKCDEAQGYLFSKPLPAAAIEPLLRTLA